MDHLPSVRLVPFIERDRDPPPLDSTCPSCEAEPGNWCAVAEERFHYGEMQEVRRMAFCCEARCAPEAEGRRQA